MRHHPRWTLKPRPLRRHPRRAADAGLPFSEDAVAETTVLKIGEGGIQPSAAEGLPQSPVPLDQAEEDRFAGESTGSGLSCSTKLLLPPPAKKGGSRGRAT